MKKYIPKDLENKWQQSWKEGGQFLTNIKNSENTYYVLVELAYSSGDLHMGHWFTFSYGDILARFKKMRGYNVILPNGFDAFGLPAENAAIKRNIHPSDWTYSNIEKMKQQFETLGAMFDWSHTTISCDPKYYKWNQWIFLKLLEKGLAYKGKVLSNWCPVDQTVLANENVESGKCWRCGSQVEQKEIEQWFFKITDYADKLLWTDKNADIDWPKSLKVAQNDWIGRSEGAKVKFILQNDISKYIEIFTTRLDTIFGATFLVVSPEHEVVTKILEENVILGTNKERTPESNNNDSGQAGMTNIEAVKEYVEKAKKKSELERKENKDKTGVFIGIYAINPANQEKIPVWIADYVLLGYGTGAIMAVPAHDERDNEFAIKFDLPIKTVILSPEGEESPADAGKKESETSSEIPRLPLVARDDNRGVRNDPSLRSNKKYSSSTEVEKYNIYTGYGTLINSEEFSGLDSQEVKPKIVAKLGSEVAESFTTYHLHDWSIGRQRYWGTPIPIIYCDNCGTVPVPEKDLPVELPYKVDYQPKGKAPLASVEDWVNTECPKCGGKAKRETETLDGFMDNSWYFFRYLDPNNDLEIFDQKIIKNWMPVDIYIGGAEHTFGHALYSRFFTKFFYDLGLIEFDEYSKRRLHHGIILGPDGNKMSKSKGNVINPDEQVSQYGADAVRVYLSFLGPIDIVTAWKPEGINGIYHFMQRVWALTDKVLDIAPDKKDLNILHKTIKKVTEDLEELKNNTAIASLMEWLNYLSRRDKISKEEFEVYLQLLAPLAPHITEELWHHLGNESSIHLSSWPEVDEKYLEEEEVTVAVQINGKVRDTLKVQKSKVKSQKDIEEEVMRRERVQKFLEGKEIKKIIYIEGKIFSIVV